MQWLIARVPIGHTRACVQAAFLGFYNSCPTVKMSVADLVRTANRFAELMGCPEPPELEAKTVGKMGLKVRGGAGRRAGSGARW